MGLGRVHGGPDSGNLRQSTISRPIVCRGVGLHSGRPIEMTLRPAPAGSGVRLIRTDVAPESGDFDATLNNVVDSRLSTTLKNSHGVSVSTIEHLMAALAGCSVDNVVIEIDGPEIPAMDGSAAPFVRLIERAEIAVQSAPRQAIKVLKPIVVVDGSSLIAVAPADALTVDFSIDFDAPAVGRQTLTLELVNGAFSDSVAAARTFGFAEEVDRLRAAGLARGGSLDNAIVVDGERILNPGGLRFEDEFVRHKILDCMGDLYLAGAPIIGRITAVRTGHSANHDLLRALFADPAAWTVGPMPREAGQGRYAALPEIAVA